VSKFASDSSLESQSAAGPASDTPVLLRGLNETAKRDVEKMPVGGLGESPEYDI